MKFKTFALSAMTAAIASTMTPAFADDQWVDVYGKVNLSLEKVDLESNGKDQWNLNSNASRFGVKGKGQAGSFESFYQMEWEIDVTDANKSSTDHIKARNQFVGLRGGFGEILAGRADTPLKGIQNSIDLFNDLSLDIKHSFNGENRVNNVIQYSTPKMGDAFKAKIAFVPGESTPDNNGLADATSIVFEYNSNGLVIAAGRDTDVEGSDVDTTRLVAQYKMDAFQFGFMFQKTDVASESENGMLASVKYSVGDNAFKFEYIKSDIYKLTSAKYDSQIALGWDHKLGKTTTVFAFLASSGVGGTSNNDQIFGLGMEQKF